MSLDQSGLHHLAAVAELKQQEEEDMEVSAGPGLALTEAVMMEAPAPHAIEAVRARRGLLNDQVVTREFET